jgi:hypothetical protein
LYTYVEVDENWRQSIQEALIKLGVIYPKYTGHITINFNAGGITNLERFDRLSKFTVSKSAMWAASTDSLPLEEIKIRQEKQNKK